MKPRHHSQTAACAFGRLDRYAASMRDNGWMRTEVVLDRHYARGREAPCGWVDGSRVFSLKHARKQEEAHLLVLLLPTACLQNGQEVIHG